LMYFALLSRFFFIDTPPTATYPLSLHDALPIFGDYVLAGGEAAVLVVTEAVARLLPGVLGNAESHRDDSFAPGAMAGLLEGPVRSEEHTSELQSRENLVCRLLLEKKK